MPYPQIIDPACPLNWAHPLNRNLMARWQCVPNPGWSGMTFRDLVRGGRFPNDMTVLDTSPARVGNRGRPGGFGSLSFNGTNSSLQTTTAAGDKFRASGITTLTICAWINANTINATGHFVVALRDSGSSGWILQVIDSGGKIIRFGALGSSNIDSTAGVIATGAWYHIAIVWVNSSSVRFFVNGQFVNAGGSTTISTGSTGTPVVLGKSFSGTTRYFDGLMDDVRIHNATFSDADIRAIFEDSRRGCPDTLNWLPEWYLGVPQAGGGATAFPWHYYQQMMAG